MKTVSVSFDCNNGRGHSKASFSAIEVDFNYGKVLQLSFQISTGGDEVPVRFGDGDIEVGGYKFAFLGEVRHYQGNLCWDAATMEIHVARRLAKYLMNQCGFTLESCDEGHPFERLEAEV